MALCGSCGDQLPGDATSHPGQCFVILKLHGQDDLPAPETTAYLDTGNAPEDAKVPVRLRQLDMSSH